MGTRRTRPRFAGGPSTAHLLLHPGPTLAIDPSLRCTASDGQDRPTYRVIRHNLGHNEELGYDPAISGSPVAMYAFDLTRRSHRDGEFIYTAYQLTCRASPTCSEVTSSTGRKNPGIFEDEMFLSNDPWVGAAHQMGRDAAEPGVWRAGLLLDPTCSTVRWRHHAGSFCPNAATRLMKALSRR